MSEHSRLVLTPSMQRTPLVLIAIGAIALVVGLVVSPERTWMNLLVDGFYVLSIGVSAIFFFATQRLSSARWSAPIRRIPEAIMRVLPAAAVLMVVLTFGFHTLYPWTHPEAMHDAHELVTPGHASYLAPSFVYTRMVIIITLWLFFAWRIRKISIASDASREAGLAAHPKFNRVAALFVPIFALTFTAAAYDWIISLDPKWFSTMFGVYVFAGSFVQGVAAIALTTILLRKKRLFGAQQPLIDNHVQSTLGTMLLAFSTFWAYIWVCQYLLIWYGNIPEEVTYYLRRSSAPWLPVFLGSFVINWVIPFFTLLPRSSKRSMKIMIGVCMLVLAGRWLDLYIMVMPEQWTSPHVGPLELAMAAGAGGLIYLIVIRGLSRAPLVPPHEPVLAQRHAHAPEGAS
ncbi:MAG: hypothetical protein ABIY55_04325 [Kofleriaceae bacterium]